MKHNSKFEVIQMSGHKEVIEFGDVIEQHFITGHLWRMFEQTKDERYQKAHNLICALFNGKVEPKGV